LKKLDQDVKQAHEHWKTFPTRIATHDQYKAQIKKNGTNFIDIDFPPVERSVQDPRKG